MRYLLSVIMIVLSATSIALSATTPLQIGIFQSDPKLQNDLNQVILRESSLSRVSISVTSYRDENAVMESMAKGNGPDIIACSVGTARMLADYGLVQPLNDLVARDKSLRDSLNAIYPAARESAYWFGYIIGLPQSMTLYGIIYNTGHTRDAGVNITSDWNWDDFAINARKLHSSRGLFVQKSPIASNVIMTTTPSAFLPFILSNGGEYVDATLTKPRLHTESSKQALSWLRNLVATDSVTVSDIWTERYLGLGVLSMAPAEASALVPLNPLSHEMSISSVSLDMVPFPKSPYTKKSVAQVPISMYVINKRSPRIDIAVKFLTASLAPRAQEVLPTLGMLPVRTGVSLSKGRYLPSSNVVAAIATTGKPHMLPVIGGMHVWKPMLQYLPPFLQGHLSLDILIEQVTGELQPILSGWGTNRRALWTNQGQLGTLTVH